MIFDQNSSLSWKRYDICPWLLWITNTRSQVANQSASVPLTLSDIERRDVRVEFFPVDHHNYTRPRKSRIWNGNIGGEKHASNWSGTPISQGAGP